MKGPKIPCGSCPYRKDVPSGVWHEEEYAKLREYEGETMDQSPAMFACHQQDGHVCSGWAHAAGYDTLALRMAPFRGTEPEVVVEIIDYVSPVPCFDTHSEAADRGMRDYTENRPSRDAERVQRRLNRKGIGT